MSDIGSPNSVLDMGEAQAAAGTLGLAVVTSKLRGAEDIAPAFEALKGRADALYVCSSPPLTTNRIQINSLALGARLPTMFGFREYTVVGRADVLWTTPSKPFSSRCRVCRQDSARGEAWRPAGRAANEVRVHNQSDDRKGAWADDPCAIDVTRNGAKHQNNSVDVGTLTAAPSHGRHPPQCDLGEDERGTKTERRTECE